MKMDLKDLQNQRPKNFHELKEDIAELSMKSQEKKQLEDQVSISDSPPLVKPFAASSKLSLNE